MLILLDSGVRRNDGENELGQSFFSAIFRKGGCCYGHCHSSGGLSD